MTRYSKNKQSCAQREKKWVGPRFAEDQINGEVSEPSEGQFFVIDKITGEKLHGQNLA